MRALFEWLLQMFYKEICNADLFFRFQSDKPDTPNNSHIYSVDSLQHYLTISLQNTTEQDSRQQQK